LSNRSKNDLKQDAIELRRERVLKLTTKCYSQRQIASALSIANGTVAYDQLYLKQKAKERIKKYVDEPCHMNIFPA
jgi:DNA-binding NarL/FixJ family response regulator